MYSYFMIIGKLELIEADIIGVNTGKECLEVNIKTSKYPELKVNDMIAVKGTIKAKGLCADKVYITNPYIQEMKESDQAEKESTQEEVEPVEEPVETVEPQVEVTETIEESQADNEYPEDFQPLYKVNEKITIKYDYDRVVEPLHILQIQPVKTDGKITGYNYKVLIEVVNGVNNKSGIKIYSEDFLADNEVIEG